MPICNWLEQDRATGLSAGLAVGVMCKYSTLFSGILQLLWLSKAGACSASNSGNINESKVFYRDGTPRKGEMNNNTLTASWNEPYSSGTSSGTIVITFDPEDYPRRIAGLSLTETRKTSDTRTFTIEGELIDFPGYKDQSRVISFYNFFASVTDVCDYLTFMDEEYRNSDGSYSYSTDGVPICDDKSGITMKLYYLEE